MKATRAAADVVADAIAIDLPQLTVHDGTHLDALWPLVDLLAVDDFSLTPTEAWVLGVAIVLHDLGLALAAYPGGIEELRAAEGWPDALAATLRRRLGSSPTSEQMAEADEETRAEADRTMLRIRHAERASELVNVEIAGAALVADEDLRRALGALTGRIAASHWWSPDELGELGPDRGAPAGMPAAWIVRPLPLAVLLRCADASHLDALRAPARDLQRRSLSPTSSAHWEFQTRLNQPLRDGDQIRFTSSSDFPREQSAAWWMCVDHLRLLDRELAAGNDLLKAAGHAPLAVRSVADIRDLPRLAQAISCKSWEPVDARVEVGDVAGLVRRLGGHQLYGNADGVPLRELIQNSADAILARRALEPGHRGLIRIEAHEHLTHFRVQDDGVGMGREVLVGALLDFGRSLWDSDELADLHPGLQAAGFQPTGRFGLGFFSVFMWTADVKVVTRGRTAGRQDTLELEFVEGVAARPLLGPAAAADRLDQSGTVVTLRGCQVEPELHHELHDEQTHGPLRAPEEPAATTAARFAEYIAELAPALSVDVDVRLTGGGWVRAVTADDWITLPQEQLLARIGSIYSSAEALEPIGPEDAPRARIALVEARPTSEIDRRGAGVLVAGGLRVARTNEAAGIILGSPLDAARATGSPLLTPAEISAWASSQATQLAETDDIALTVRVLELGGRPDTMPLALSAEGPLSQSELMRWAVARGEIMVLDSGAQLSDERDHQWIPPHPAKHLAANALDFPERWWSRERGLLVGERRRLLSDVVRSAVEQA